MARVNNIEVDALQGLLLSDTLYLPGTPDYLIDARAVAPDDITGRDYETVIHKTPGDGVQLLRYTVNSPPGGSLIPIGMDGVLQTIIPPVDLATLISNYGYGTFVYYIRRIDNLTVQPAVVTKGTFTVDPV